MIPEKAFYFVRHGETEWNKLNIYTGTKDIPLNSEGINQAKAAGILLQNEPISEIISSNLTRAKQTADIIADYIHKPVAIVNDIHERYLGQKEGTPIIHGISIEKLVADTNNHEEESAVFQARVIKAMSYILAKFPKNVLIVSHGGVYAALSRAMKWPIIDIKNCQPFYHAPPSKLNSSWQISNLDN